MLSSFEEQWLHYVPYFAAHFDITPWEARDRMTVGDFAMYRAFVDQRVRDDKTRAAADTSGG